MEDSIMRQKECLVWQKLTLGLSVLLLSLSLVFPNIARSEGCQTGAEAIANAYVRYNPINAYFFGSIEDYVKQNRSHFVAGGDAVVCAQRLSQALAQSAFQLYDPGDQRRRDEVNARLGGMGISPGQQYASPAQQNYAMARQMDKLANALPYAANGNYGPLWTPRDQLEQMQLFAMQLFPTLLQDPIVRSAFIQMQPMIEELVNIEYRMILSMAKKQ